MKVRNLHHQIRRHRAPFPCVKTLIPANQAGRKSGKPAQLDRGITGEAFAAHVTRQRLEALSRLVATGALRPQVGAVLPLEQAREALAQVDGRHVRGKVVLRIGQ